MEKLTVVVDGKEKEFILRTGTALPPVPEKAIRESGNILAPGKWLDVRKADPQKDHVMYSRKDMKIIFVQDEKNGNSTIITGVLKINDDLTKFNINTSTLWATGDLAKFLKMNRLFFADADQCAKIIAELNALKAKIQTDIEQSQNARGNSKNMVSVNVTTNVPLRFRLRLPVFVGFNDNIFTVEVGIETSDREVQLWLESAELNEIILRGRNNIINQEIAKFEAAGMPIIEY